MRRTATSVSRKPAGFDYDEYLRSEAWGVRRQWKLEEADHKCQTCSGPDELNVHHRNYDNLGNERQCDLVVLCRSCHKLFHGIPDQPAPDAEVLRQRLNIIPDPARWGEHATRVAEINREIRFVGEAEQMALLREKEAIARAVRKLADQ
jgi:hypothetical protein